MKTKKGEKEKLRELILDKAVAFFKRHGKGGSGTEDVMTYMGLSRGALYSHFKSKDDLFAQAIARDLSNLEANLEKRFKVDGTKALKKIIRDHLSKGSLENVEASCVFTSLSTDMQRAAKSHRALYEDSMQRMYLMFAEALASQFPNDTPSESFAKAVSLYSGLVGTLTMARTTNDEKLALEILGHGRKFLIKSFVPR